MKLNQTVLIIFHFIELYIVLVSNLTQRFNKDKIFSDDNLTPQKMFLLIRYNSKLSPAQSIPLLTCIYLSSYTAKFPMV